MKYTFHQFDKYNRIYDGNRYYALNDPHLISMSKWDKELKGLLEQHSNRSVRPSQEEKASQLLDQVIADIRNEKGDEILQQVEDDARVYLNRQYGIEDQFMQAGLSPTQARAVEALAELQGYGVPSAFIHQPKPGLEQRVHTRYGTNPLTGQQEIVPFTVDGAPLVTNLGRDVPMNGHEKATEYVQEQAMKLAGLPVQRNNNTGRPTAPDFKVGNQIVDGEIRFDTEGTNIPIQLYTSITPSNHQGMDQYAVRNVVRDMISKKLDQGHNIYSAIDTLSNERQVSSHRGGRPYEGKLLKKGRDRIDKLIMPTLTKKQALENKAARDTIAIAPQSVRIVELDAVDDLLAKMPTEEMNRRIQIRANQGNNLDAPRGRVYVRVDQNSPGVSYDLASRPGRGHVAQLYS